MGVEIRPARADEGEAILPMYDWLFEAPGYRPATWDEAAAAAALAEATISSGSLVLVAEDTGALIGLCTAYLELNSIRYGQRCWVEDLAVHPEHRSEGVGGALLDAAMAWAREHGATHFELDTAVARADAQRFYERRDPAAKGISYSWML
jgi:GNAT superfamily N-acetyltransferase